MSEFGFADLSRERLRELLAGFADARLAVVGDYFLDRYLFIDPALTEPSIETGLDAWQVVGKRPQPGAAGTVTSNLAELEVGEIRAVGLVGDDGEGYEMRQGLAATGVDCTHLLSDADVVTPTYCKPMRRDADGTQTEMNRFDSRNREPTSNELRDAIIEQLRACVPEMDGIIVADQEDVPDWGVITPRVVDELARLAEEYPEKVFLADSRGDISRFRGLIIKPNNHEACQAAGVKVHGEPTVEQAAQAGRLLFERNQRPVYVTMGADGMMLFDEDGATHLPGVRVEGEIDIVGAGDSVTAGIVSALCAGATHAEAGMIGNLVASITIQQIGATGTATREQVLAQHER